MKGVYLLELFRTIRSSLGRFVAIFGIVALGCGFFAGLMMCGLDMRSAADAFYDGTALYDIRVVSTMGITDEQIRLIEGVEGVESISGAYALDTMGSLGDEQVVFRITSFDPNVASRAVVDDAGITVASDDASYLNRLILTEGRWPERPNECVASAFRTGSTVANVGDTIDILYGTSDLDGVLDVRRYRIVGLVFSPTFVSNSDLGYTNLGSGIVQQYLYVLESAFAEELPYTEVYLSVSGAADEVSYSDGYQRIVDEVADRLELRSGDIAASRLAQVKADAQAELDDARDEFENEKRDAEAQLADARAQLEEAERELAAAQARIDSGQADLDAGRAELARSRRQAYDAMEAARRKLEDAERQLDEGEAELGMTQADIDAARAELEDGKAELAEGEEQLAQAEEEWAPIREGLVEVLANTTDVDTAMQALRDLLESEDMSSEEVLQAAEAATRAGSAAASALAEYDGLDEEQAATLRRAAVGLGIAAEIISRVDPETFDPADPAQVDALINAIEQATGLDPSTMDQRLDEIRSTVSQAIEEGDAAIADARKQVEDGRAQLEEAEELLEKAQDARDTIDAGRAELSDGWKEFREQETRLADEFARAQARLDDAAAELARGRSQLAEGRAEYESGLAEYRSSRRRADGEFADAAAQLAEAQADIDELEEPDVYILDRTKNISVASYKQNSERIDHIAEVFPLMFFLVAALVALTTMTRMVEEERVEIGTHKALGFTTAQITMKYVSYALLAGLAGSVVGILILSQVLPYVVIIAYNIMYGIPLPPFPIPIDLSIAFMATVAGVGITLIATWGAAAATLREVPAQLMLPRAPAAGKRILLEHITPIWKRMSFTWKVTMRNLFRYKRRLAMTIIGIAGCTALLLTGLGLHDSIWDIIDNQFEGPDPIVHYTVMVGFDEGMRPEQREDARRVLEETGEATVLTFAEDENMQAGSAHSKDNVAVSVLIPLDCDSFTETITMRDRITGAPIEMDGSSVIITEKAANILGVRAGDTITLYEQDDIGNAIGSGYAFTIDAVTESYVRHFLYVGNDAWKEAMGEGMEPNMVLANVRDEEEVRLEVSRSLHDVGGISTVSFNSEAIQTYRQSLSSVNMIVVVLVVAAAALAFIVLYNLTNINIVERTREIASLKVLGFTRIDVAIYVFREVFLLVIMGAVLGLGLGTVLEGFVVKAAEVDVVMFGRDIHPPSYLIAFVVTLVFTGLVMLAMLPKLRSIDMVESLKSVD